MLVSFLKNFSPLGMSVNYITTPAWDHNTAYALNIDNIVADVKGMFAAQ